MKIIKILGFTKMLSTNSKNDEFLSKIKPILGQNQISLPNFIIEFNKKSILFNEGVPVRIKIFKKDNKNFEIDFEKPTANSIISQWIKSKKLLLTKETIQDLFLVLKKFDDKLKKETILSDKSNLKVYLSNIKK